MTLLSFCGLLFRLFVFVIAPTFNKCPSAQLLFIQVKHKTAEEMTPIGYLQRAEVKVGFIKL